ncbi:leucine-rich repeat protein [Bacteroides nordii]|uniref:leucine-rich repeat protein n=1 Tax=Bacteroides nordii TaxID=291645 RepID=UPI002A8163FE|nr:leucine-rich repeat protein [Bacteroides nordii]
MKRRTTLLLVIFLMIVGSKGIAQNFNTAIFGNTGFPVAFEQSPDYPWVVSEGCVSSSNIVGLKTSWFSTTVDIVEASGSVKFDYKVDSEGYGEKFYFSIDDQDIINVGRMDWTTVSYELPKGKHTLKWTYVLSGGFPGGFYAYIKSMSIQGINIEKPIFSISGSVIDYKNKVSDSKTTESLEITNLGNQNLVIEKVSGLSTPFEVVSYPTAAIAKGTKASIEVQYSPTEEGYWKQDLVIVSNAGTHVISVKALCSKSYTVEVPVAGQLSSLVQDANSDSITIMGYLNESDFRFMKNNMPNLKYLNLSATSITGNRIPNYALQSKKTLCEVVLPYTLKVVGYQAFDQCSALQRIVFSEGLEQIEQGGFHGCTSLSEMKLPVGLKEIKGNAFANCRALTSIELPDALTFLRSQAFRECTGLTEITLPASLQYCDYPFYNCSNIKRINCYASVPPTLEGNRDILYNVDKSTCELLVPFWSVNNYKLTSGWDAFPVINPSEYETDVINIRRNLTLAEGIRPTLQPCVSVFDNGHFAVKGTDAFSMKRYTQSHVLAMYANSSNYDRSQYTSLISESTAMRADSVIYTMSAWGEVWMYLSFPFDVKVSDIEVSDGGLYAIRKYDGATRAQGGTNNWKDMTDDSILHAGEGYIIQFNKNVNRFALKAINNDNKNRLFSGNALSRELGEYISEFAHNRSWNFVGNPYPCYFDIRYMNYTAPVTVWNGRGYMAISPEDDNYILKPMQAFFVQKPVDMDAITFLPEGRQMDTSIRARMAVRTAAVESNRTIYNLALASSEYTDNTRIVVNPVMSMGYDMARDAAKFMSDDKEVPQLFSLDASSMRYAINERPVGTGIIPLGVYIGKAGSYTFSLGENMEQCGEVLLIDKQAKQEVRLKRENYTFVADAGTYDSRFEIRLDVTSTGVETGEMISATTVKGGNQQIEITTEKGNLITVYGTTGQKQTKLIATESSVTIPSVPGFYVVMVNGESFKTVVTK